MKNIPISFMSNTDKVRDFFTLIPQWLFIALFAFPAFPLLITNILFALFSISVIAHWIYQKPTGVWKNVKTSFLISLPFVPYLIEFLLHTNNSTMQFELQKKLLFFIAPITITAYISIFKPQSIRIYFTSFTIAVVAVSILSIIGLVYHGILFSPNSYENGAYLLRFHFESISHLHPTYYSLFSTISALWIIYDFKNYSSKWKIIFIIFLIILIFLLLLIAAKMPLIIMALGCSWLLSKKIKSRKLFSAIYIGFVMLAIAAIFIVPSLKSRLMEVKNYYTSPNSEQNTLQQRQVIFDCNIEIFKQHVWTGVGASNSQLELDNCYKSTSTSGTESTQYNAHNQFFTLVINYGIAILFVFICTLIVTLKQSQHFHFGIVMIISIVLIMLTESILERQMGIYFYLLFSLLLLQSKNFSATS
jgi:O-antigen ligase